MRRPTELRHHTPFQSPAGWFWLSYAEDPRIVENPPISEILDTLVQCWKENGYEDRPDPSHLADAEPQLVEAFWFQWVENLGMRATVVMVAPDGRPIRCSYVVGNPRTRRLAYERVLEVYISLDGAAESAQGETK